MQHRYRLFLMLATALGSMAHAATGEYYGPGYTLISAAGDDSDLQTVVYRQLYPGTVGQALPQLLEGTGWRLADSYAADVRIYRLYNQPLPEHKLRIGPMALDKALTNLAGDGWELVVDPVNRLVSFEVRERYDTTPRPLSTTRGTTVTPSAPVYADTYPDYTASYPVASAPYPSPLSGNTYSDSVVAQGDFSTLHYLNDPAPVSSRVTSKRRADVTPIRPASQRADDPADAISAKGHRVTATAKAGRQSRRTEVVGTENIRKSSRSPSSAVNTTSATSTTPSAVAKPTKAGSTQHESPAAETKNASAAKRTHRAVTDANKATTAATAPANSTGKTSKTDSAAAVQTAASTKGKTAPSATVAKTANTKTAADPAQSPSIATKAAAPVAPDIDKKSAPATPPASATKADAKVSPSAAPSATTNPHPATEKAATAEPALLHQGQGKPASDEIPVKASDTAAQSASSQPSAAPPAATFPVTDSHATTTATVGAPSSIAKPPLKAAGQPQPTGDVVVGKPTSPRPPLAAAKAVAPGEITPAATAEHAP